MTNTICTSKVRVLAAVHGNANYDADIARIAALGVPAYSFSISWSRIMPFGRGPINEEGLAHYDDVINTCLEYGVEPIVTLYHWDLPLYVKSSHRLCPSLFRYKYADFL